MKLKAFNEIWTRWEIGMITSGFVIFSLLNQFSIVPLILHYFEIPNGWWLVIGSLLQFIETLWIVMIVRGYPNLRTWFLDQQISLPKKKWYPIAALGIFILFIRMILMNALADWFPKLAWGAEFFQEAFAFGHLYEYILFILVVVFAGPIIEEFFFRGWLQRIIRKKYSAAVSIGISSFVFGALHIIPLQAIGGIIMGVFLGFLYEKSESIWPSLFAHILNNAIIAISFLFLMSKGGGM